MVSFAWKDNSECQSRGIFTNHIPGELAIFFYSQNKFWCAILPHSITEQTQLKPNYSHFPFCLHVVVAAYTNQA